MLALSRRSDRKARAKYWHGKKNESSLVFPAYKVTRSPPSERLEQTRDSGLWDLKDVLNSRQNRFKIDEPVRTLWYQNFQKKFLSPGYGPQLKNFDAKIDRSYDAKES